MKKEEKLKLKEKIDSVRTPYDTDIKDMVSKKQQIITTITEMSITSNYLNKLLQQIEENLKELKQKAK